MNAVNRKCQKLEDLQCMKTEMELRQELLQSLATEQAKKELSSAARLNDADLVDRLFKAGFTADDLPALTAVPIAFVAWGSGQVTSEEFTVAMQAVLNSEVSEKPSAIAKFQSWLQKRPAPELFYLWNEFTRARAQRSQACVQEVSRMMNLVTQVAATSGGILGLGAICAGERSIIHRVRDVLEDIADTCALPIENS
jgi:hypothetical protein